MTNTAHRFSPLAPLVDAPSLRVLFVDDNVDAAEMSAEALGLLGHEAQAAHSGAEALALAERATFDVAVVDIGLPDMDGYQLGRLLKQRYPAMSVIALTGYAQAEHRERSRKAGFAGHLVKPIELAVLAQMLADVANGQAS
jgi:CheY-like chemotaxis protein